MSIPRRVEFISYTGKYPNSCSNGCLTLSIDGAEHTFCDGEEKDGIPAGDHRAFWSPGCSMSWEEHEKCKNELIVPVGSFELYSALFPDELADVFFETAYVLQEEGVFASHCGGCR